MNPDELASGAILITLWEAEERRARGAGRTAELIAIHPICGLVTDILGRGDSPATLNEALRQAPSDDHARATLQRHVAEALRDEPALVNELLKRLLDIGQIHGGEGVTQINISLPGAHADGREGIRISLTFPWPGGAPSRLTPPTGYVGRNREIEEVLSATESADSHVRVVVVAGHPVRARRRSRGLSPIACTAARLLGCSWRYLSAVPTCPSPATSFPGHRKTRFSMHWRRST